MGSIGHLFRYSDGLESLDIALDFRIGDGLMTPLTMLVLSGLINEYRGTSGISFSIEIVNKYSLRLLYVAIGVGISAFVEGLCWTRTAERQNILHEKIYVETPKQEKNHQTQRRKYTMSKKSNTTISSDAHIIQDTMAEKLPNCLAHLTSFISYLIIAFVLSRRLALVALPFSLLFIVPGVGFGKKMNSLGSKARDAYGIAGGIAEQAISSIALMGMIYAVLAVQAWVGSVLVTERGEKGGLVFISGVCIMHLGRSRGKEKIMLLLFKNININSVQLLLGKSIMNGLPNLSSILEATIAATRFLEMIDRIPIIDSEAEKGEIEFKEIDFSYPSRPDTPVLRGSNLRVEAGKTVGLVGGSGSGKSTIISLLERFYDPVNGDILLDKYKIKRLQVKWLRSLMGLVNQQPILFATSIKENILFGKEEAPMDLAANAHDFIIKLPQGYETQVGKFGVQLSGGQKQRIAIARALIRDTRILLFDEATSALDSQSKRIVQEALDKASEGRTTIIIAHCLSTILRADLIVVLQSGSMVKFGSHDELIHMNNGEGRVYSKMVHLQHPAMQNEAFDNFYHPREDTNLGRMISAMAPQTPINVRSSRQISQWRLLQMSAPEWKQSLLGCLGAVGFGTIQPIHAYYLGTFVSVYFKDDNSSIRSETRFYSCIFLSLAVLSFIVNLLQHYNFGIMGECLTRRIGWFDQDDNTSAAICARLATEANMIRSLIVEHMSLLVQVFFSASVAFVLGLVVTWRVAIVMIAMQPLLIASFYSRSVLMKRLSKKAKKAQSKGSQLATAVSLTFWYGGRSVNQKSSNTFFILISTGKNIADAGSMTSDIAKGSNAIRSIFAIIDRRSEIEPKSSTGIRVKNLKIEAGKTMVLVGQSGSGKSNVIGLIERFYDPIRGSIFIDECDIKSYNLRKLRSHIALVSQEPTLFAGTICENIVYGKEHASESEVRKATILANAHEFKRSATIRMQKRRIALAGAILKDPTILLLDKATSALDSVSENLVQEALEKTMVGRTCVIVAHRLSTIQKANNIAVIRDGKVVELGSHLDLLAVGCGGAYYSLIQQQRSHSTYM
ncbi:hypothetical protein I3843_05G158300 [Carya illinoinensis]|nr:hypothetical protein I3843_05G158300 [Carya illinoinensis]